MKKAKMAEESYYPDDDARTLTRAQEILKDPKRKKAALGELKKQANAAAEALAKTQAIADTKKNLDSVFKGSK